MGFLRYLARRLLLLLVVMWGAVTLTFLIVRIIPSNPVSVMVGSNPEIDPSAVKELTAAWGLNQPLPVQYFDYVRSVLQGNLGVSFFSGNSVVVDLASRLPATVELSIAAMIFTLVIGIPIAIVAATRKGSVIDRIARIVAMAGYSAPSFWLGILLLLVFGLDLHWLGVGRLSPQFAPPPHITGLYTVDSLLAGNIQLFTNAVEHLILPGITLGLGGVAVTMRLLRSSMLETMSTDYVRTARMKGLKEWAVIYRHAFRNALIPMTTYFGLLVGYFLSGSVLIETIFNWNGIGQYLVNSIYNSDYPAIQGVVLVDALIFATTSLIVDLAYALIDPRIRHS